jgi:hypothetical protein
VIYNKARTETSEFTSREVENKAVWALKPAHIRLDELTELDFHIDAVGTLSDFYTRDRRMRIAKAGTRVFLRKNEGRSESEQQKHKRYCRMDTHRCGRLRPL